MSAPEHVTAPPRTLRLDDEQHRFARSAVGLVCSVAVTGLIFYGISRIQEVHTRAPEPPLEDLHAVILPLDTPPPVIPPTQTTPVVVGTPVQFEIASEPSPVSIQISPAPVVPIDTVAPLAHPGITARFELGAGVVHTEVASDPNHVFETSEVDQKPVPVFRKTPNVTTTIFKRVKNPRVVLLFVVTAEGSVTDARLLKSSGDKEFDDIMLEMIADWDFRPAMKKGKPVRCWVQQGVHLTLGAVSRFH